jgi:hypothetical protein
MAAKPKAGKRQKETKAKAPKKEKSQRERFIETAREIGVDESGAEFESAIKRIIPPKNSTPN